MITLATLEFATAQQVFDQVKNHLLKQNKKSINDNVSRDCMYLSKNGEKCAAGCLIDDHEYHPSMETNSWLMLVQRGRVPHHHYDLISGLQHIHDRRSVDEWPHELAKFAYHNNLKY